MRKFNARWWVDEEFLGRRTDHNIDTFELLLEQHKLILPLRPLAFSDVALRGPKTTIVFDYTARKRELHERMSRAAEVAIDAAKAFTAAQAEYGRYITSSYYEFWWPGL